MKVIHQPTPFSCMACVAAMITNEPLEEVFDAIGHDGSQHHFRFLDIAAFLNRRGFHLGLLAPKISLFPRLFVRRYPALLIVESPTPNNHAVYWTGSVVLDPSSKGGIKPLSNYQVLQWWPVFKMEDK
jgi:hypothetical protein